MCIEIGRVHFCFRGISSVVGVVGDGGAVATTVANANSYQLRPHCEMNVHWIWTSPFSPLRVGGISPVVAVLSATVVPWQQQWLMRIHIRSGPIVKWMCIEFGRVHIRPWGWGGSVQSSVLSATVAPRRRRRQQWLAADVGKVYSTRLFSHRRRVLCTPGYLTSLWFKNENIFLQFQS